MRVAALDLGTNTFLILIAEVEDGRVKKVLHDEVRIVRLGQDVDRTRKFQPEALSRAAECLRDFAVTAKKFGAERTLACATSAARDVSNAEELIAIGERNGIRIDIISGEQEAEDTFRGTVPDHLDHEVLVVDIGGGSTEFVFGDGNGIASRISLDIGAVRLTEKYITQHPISSEEMAKLKTAVTVEVAKALSNRPSANAWSNVHIVAVAGTPTTLATIDQGLLFESNRVQGYHLTGARISHWVSRLAAMSIDERRALAGMEPKRADVIVAGALILSKVVELFGAREVEVSVRGLRYGVARRLGGAQ